MVNNMTIEKQTQGRCDCNKQGKDKKFKENIKVEGYEEYKTKNEQFFKFYHPDKILKKDNSIIILESSSAGDRKVHIGELTQFLTYVSCCDRNIDIYFVLFLCGDSKTAPKVENEIERLRYYYNNYPMKNSDREKIKGVYINWQNEVGTLTLEQIKKFDRVDK